MRYIVLALCFLTAVPALPAWAEDGTGRIKGTVLDIDTKEPLVGATVLVTGTKLGASTGADGSYAIAGVPAGIRTDLAGEIAEVFRREIDGGVGELPQVRAVDMPVGRLVEHIAVDHSRDPGRARTEMQADSGCLPDRRDDCVDVGRDRSVVAPGGYRKPDLE